MTTSPPDPLTPPRYRFSEWVPFIYAIAITDGAIGQILAYGKKLEPLMNGWGYVLAAVLATVFEWIMVVTADRALKLRSLGHKPADWRFFAVVAFIAAGFASGMNIAHWSGSSIELAILCGVVAFLGFLIHWIDEFIACSTFLKRVAEQRRRVERERVEHERRVAEQQHADEIERERQAEIERVKLEAAQAEADAEAARAEEAAAKLAAEQAAEETRVEQLRAKQAEQERQDRREAEERERAERERIAQQEREEAARVQAAELKARQEAEKKCLDEIEAHAENAARDEQAKTAKSGRPRLTVAGKKPPPPGGYKAAMREVFDRRAAEGTARAITAVELAEAVDASRSAAQKYLPKWKAELRPAPKSELSDDDDESDRAVGQN